MDKPVYKIYEYPGYKVGVTKRSLKQRDYENRLAFTKRGIYLPEIILLETSTDINYITERERELQLQRGYQTDARNYKLSLIGNEYSLTKESKNKWKNTYKNTYLKSLKRIDDLKKHKKTRQKVAIAMGRGNRKKVSQYTKDGEFIRTFHSLTAAAEAMGCSKEGIIAVCRGKYGCNTIKGYVWKYAE